jgi:hypothetical protein
MAEAEKAGDKPAKVKVYVRAVPREGFNGFCRAGRFWPSANFTEAEVTPEEFAILRDETMLMVFDQPPLGFEGGAPPASNASSEGSAASASARGRR